MKGTHAKRVLVVAALTASLVAGAWACLDLTPITAGDVAPPPSLSDAATGVSEASLRTDGASDGGPLDGDGSLALRDVVVVPPCQNCIQQPDTPGPGCSTELTACLVDPTCTFVWKCVVGSGCLLAQTGNEVIDCADPCVIEAGLSSDTTGPGLLVANLAVCAFEGPCAEAGICAPSGS
jgi:hypothetical protein